MPKMAEIDNELGYVLMRGLPLIMKAHIGDYFIDTLDTRRSWILGARRKRIHIKMVSYRQPLLMLSRQL